jgi:hypothetical protein
LLACKDISKVKYLPVQSPRYPINTLLSNVATNNNAILNQQSDHIALFLPKTNQLTKLTSHTLALTMTSTVLITGANKVSDHKPAMTRKA